MTNKILPLLFIGAFGLSGCDEPQRDAISFNSSMFETCLAVASTPEDVALQQKLANDPIIDKLKVRFGERFTPNTDHISNKKEQINAYASALPNYEAALEKYWALGTELLPDTVAPNGMKVNVVCGTPSDGYGFEVNGKKELFIDVSNISQDFFPHLMVHELWHMGFNAAYPAMREQHSLEGGNAPAMKYLAFQILNEGVGHYYSFRRRLEPEIVYDNWAERTTNIFALLEEKTAALALLNDKDEQLALIRSGHMGVPFWRKWAAVTGAVATYRLKTARGTAAVAELVQAGPCAFIAGYNSEAENQTAWEKIPKVIEEAACIV